jgi:hypothetical protein
VPGAVPLSRPAPRRLGAGLVPLAVTVVMVLAGCGGGDQVAEPGVPSVSPSATPVPDPAAGVTNGVDDRPADEVLSEAVESLLLLPSYRVSGSPTAGAPLDLVFVPGGSLTRPSTGDGGTTPAGDASTVGRGVTGTLSLAGSTFEIISVDGSVYVRGNLDWLAEVVSEDARRTLGKKWLLLPAEAAERLGTVTDPDAFARALLEPDGTVQAVGVSTVAGQPALGIRYVDTGATTWVAGTGPVLPLLVERVGATATDGVLTFSDLGAEVTLKPPRADAVVVVPPSGRDVGR